MEKKILDLALEDENKFRRHGLTNRQVLLWTMKVIARWRGAGLVGFEPFVEFVGRQGRSTPASALGIPTNISSLTFWRAALGR